MWAVANANDPTADFPEQVAQTLAHLEAGLAEAGSDRTRLLSVQVILAHIAMRGTFDELWVEWIGPDPAHWPQRAIYEGRPSPGLLIEIIATATRS